MPAALDYAWEDAGGAIATLINAQSRIRSTKKFVINPMSFDYLAHATADDKICA